MKKLLIATDFSPAAKNAGRYGVCMAAAFRAKVILFHVYQSVYAASEIGQYIGAAEVEQMALYNLADEASILHADKHSKFDTFAEEGPVAATIAANAAAHGVDLIVLGMKMKYKGWRKLFGSTVTALASRSAVPLLVVPEGTKFRGISVFAVAVAFDISTNADPHLLDVLTALAEQYRAAVYLVHISEKKIEDAYQLLNRPYRLLKILDNDDTFFENDRNKNASDGLIHFIENFHVDVLVMFTLNHSGSERLSHQHITRHMIYESNIPVLLLPDMSNDTIDRPWWR